MLRTAVIGLGAIGNLHADIYRSVSDLRAVCDIDAARATAAGERLGVPWFASAEAMFAREIPDVCSVCTGGFEYASDHYEPTIEALRAGCDVLVEKPICNEVDRAEGMVRTARELGRRLAVNFNHRFTPAARLAREWMAEGRIGDLLFANVSLWIGRPGEFDSPYFHIKALNPHSIDLIRHFCGEIAEVHCFAMKAPGRELWSTASFNFRLASGAVAHLTSSYDLARGHPMERCEIAGTKGRLVLDDMWRELTLYPADSMVKSVYTNPVFGGFRDFSDTFRERIQAFLREVEEGVPPESIDGSGEDGLAGQRVIAAAIESLESGQVVQV